MRSWPSIFLIATLYVFPGTPPAAGAAELGVLAKTEIVTFVDKDLPKRAELIAKFNEFSKICPFAEFRFVDSIEQAHSHRAVLGDRQKLQVHLSEATTLMMESQIRTDTPNLVGVVAVGRHQWAAYEPLDSISQAARFIVVELCSSTPAATALKDAPLPFEVVASPETFRAHERSLEQERQQIEREHQLLEEPPQHKTFSNEVALQRSLNPFHPFTEDDMRVNSVIRTIDSVRDTLNRTSVQSSSADIESEVEHTELEPNQLRVHVPAIQDFRGFSPLQVTLRRLSGGKIVDETILDEPVNISKPFYLNRTSLEMVRLHLLSSLSSDQLAQLYLSIPKEPVEPEEAPEQPVKQRIELGFGF